MRLLVLRCWCVLLLLTCIIEPGFGRTWTADEIPNPMVDVSQCGRGGKISWVCDPDTILGPETADAIDAKLEFIHNNITGKCGAGVAGFQVAVAIIERMSLGRFQSAERGAEAFARHLHDRWGVGEAQCNNGVVLFLSIHDRRVFISTGEGSLKLVTRSKIQRIIKSMRPRLRRSDYAGAVSSAVDDIARYLQGSGWLEYLLGWGLVLGIAGLIGFAINSDRKYQKRRAECQRKLNAIEQERAAAKAEQYQCRSCPICLEEFSESPQLTTRILRCGHTFHTICMDQWEDAPSFANCCPICREPISGHPSNNPQQEPQPFEQPEASSSSSFPRGFRRPPSMPDFHFRLRRLHRRYPDIITTEQMGRWESPTFTGPLEMPVRHVSSTTTRRSSTSSSSASRSKFGGGRSSRRGGGGGGW